MLTRARSMLEEIEPASSIEQGLKDGMSSALDNLELAHSQLSVQQVACQSLWQHFDALRMQLRRCQGLSRLRQDLLEQVRETETAS